MSDLPPKSPTSVEPYHIVWCDVDGTNTNSTTNTGELAGATISTSAWLVPSGITEDSNSTGSITIAGVSYGANTVATIWLSGGTANETYRLKNTITTSDSRTLTKVIDIKVDPQ